MRKPKRKKSKFVFKHKAGKIIVRNNNNVWLRHAPTITYMQDFGYHDHAINTFTVFHIPTGLDIAYVQEEKEARIIIKKLYVKIKRTEWKIKNPDPFDITLQLMDMALNISKVLNAESLPIQNKNFVPNDDIPF